MTAVAACRTCGTELLENARFCHGCGSPVKDGDTRAEYKAEAEAAIERLAAAPADEGFVAREIWLLRLRALLARAHGDAATYAQLRDRYRDMAKTLGFEGHIAWAEAVP
jgi:hypothetical protein